MNFFDLHCDTATEAMKIHAGLYGSGLQLDLDRWQGGSLCQSYAVFIPDTLRGEPAWQYFVRCSTYWKEKIAETGKMTLLDHLAEAESCWKRAGMPASLRWKAEQCWLAGWSMCRPLPDTGYGC